MNKDQLNSVNIYTKLCREHLTLTKPDQIYADILERSVRQMTPLGDMENWHCVGILGLDGSHGTGQYCWNADQ